MNRIPQENTARKTSPDFDCELPLDARAEFTSPKRARILSPTSPPKRPPGGNPVTPRSNVAGRWLWVLFFALVLMVLAGRFATTPASRPVAVPPAAQSSPTPAQQPPASHSAPRAQLVPTPIRRATLYRLPSQELGVYKWYTLPAEWNGGSVWARYMGTKEHFSQIPFRNSQPGDLWNVTETGASWIYCFPQGHARPIWIDP